MVKYAPKPQSWDEVLKEEERKKTLEKKVSAKPLSGEKVRVTIWLDKKTVEKFKATGRDWHVRIREALIKAAP